MDFRKIAALVVLVFLVAACGVSVSTGGNGGGAPETVLESVESSTTSQPATTQTTIAAVEEAFPVTVAAGNGEVTIESRPQAIISLSPTATEMLFAVGAGSQVVAVDEYSTYPADAPITDLSGWIPNIEAIISYGPDLVVVSNDIDDIVANLETLRIQVLVMPAVSTIEGTFEQMEQLGAAVGRLAEATRATGELRHELDSLLSSLENVGATLTYYHELDPNFFSVTSSTFIGGVYHELGLVNIADPADIDGFGYPQLSVEFIVDADPDLIFVTDCCGESIDTISARPGWGSISAVQTGSIIVVDDDIASRWGPRTIEYLEAVADAIATLAVAGG